MNRYPARCVMPPSRYGDELRDLVEALVDQLRILRSLLNISKGDPDSGALDIPDGLGWRSRPHIDVTEAGVRKGQVPPLAPNRFGWQPVGELGDGVDREQRMVGEAWRTAIDRRANASANAAPSISTRDGEMGAVKYPYIDAYELRIAVTDRSTY